VGAEGSAQGSWGANSGWGATGTAAAAEPESEESQETATPGDAEDEERAWREGSLREQNSLNGSTGLLHLVTPSSGAQGTFRVSFMPSYFAATGFLCNSSTPCPTFGTESSTREDSVDRVGVHLGLSATPWPFLEAYIGFHNSATSDNRSRPQLLQVLGDTNFGVKAFLPSAPDQIFQFGGALDLYLLNGMGGVGVDGSGTSFGMKGMAALALDRRSDPEKAIPLRFHFNMGYLFDNSASLVEDLEQEDPPEGRGQNISRIERFGLDINRVDFFQIGLGGEFVHEIIRPFVEWTIDVPVNRQNYVCNVNDAEAQGDLCLGDNQTFSVAPSRLTLGARLFPWKGRGLSLLGAFDIGTGATSTFVDEVAPEPPWTFYFGLGYAVDTEPPKPIIKRVETPVAAAAPIAPDSHVEGKVVEKGTGTPVPNAIVRFDGRALPGMVTDEQGGFTSVDLEPGTYTFKVTAAGYREGQCTATVTPSAPGSAPAAAQPAQPPVTAQPGQQPGAWGDTQSGAGDASQPGFGQPQPATPEPAVTPGGKPADVVVPVQCELEALPKVGNVVGGLVDQESGQAVAGAKVIITDRLNRSLELAADSNGAFRFENVPPGVVKITVEAEGYFTSSNEFTIKPREDTSARISLNKRPTQPNVVVTGRELKLKKQVHFVKDSAELSPDSSAILEEIADVLKSHPEIQGVEVQGHTDNQGTPPYNLRLSQNRAQAVVDELVKLGVDGSRLEAKGYGQDKPLLPNTSEANKARNRRVQLIIKGK
jgi:outer membrane protein OmpA-like peptidoglycan-associated protein